jgi:hypothetical protein
MTLKLGPMPPAVREVVRRLVAQALAESQETDERLKGYFVCGGPGGCTYLDAEGEVWNHSFGFPEQPDEITLVPDGPQKVTAVAIAAERVPELAEWLPRRPAMPLIAPCARPPAGCRLR